MIIDANIFQGYFQADIGSMHNLFGCPKALVNSASQENPIYHDLGRIIESEWRNLVEPEWFEGWLAGALASGLIAILNAPHDNAIEKKVSAQGFPKSKDVVYIRLGACIAKSMGACNFYTEDMDFYDPSLKGCAAKTRKRLITTSAGPVAKILRKHSINVQCTP